MTVSSSLRNSGSLDAKYSILSAIPISAVPTVTLARGILLAIKKPAAPTPNLAVDTTIVTTSDAKLSLTGPKKRSTCSRI